MLNVHVAYRCQQFHAQSQDAGDFHSHKGCRCVFYGTCNISALKPNDKLSVGWLIIFKTFSMTKMFNSNSNIVNNMNT